MTEGKPSSYIIPNMGSRPISLFFLTDRSYSMADHKIQALNTSIRDAVSSLQPWQKEHPEAVLSIRSIWFSDGAAWHDSESYSVDDYEWIDLTVGGQTDMGSAFGLLADHMDSPEMDFAQWVPVIILVTDGYPTDKTWESELDRLLATRLGKRSIRVGIAIGDDAEHGPLREFMGSNDVDVLTAHNAAELEHYVRVAVLTSVKESSEGKQTQTPSIVTDPSISASSATVWKNLK